MPNTKRSLDIGPSDPITADKVQRKTERSHEENQERAYIAASRRTDRSLEARVQSARMASEIHKKRTGKSFRISEDIVRKEEMYEEEDDDFPRSYRLLGPHMQTASPEMNSRVEAYLSNRMAMSALLARTNESWRENEINKMFEASFPNASRQARQHSQSLTGHLFPGPGGQAEDQTPSSPDPTSPAFQSVNYQQESAQADHGRHGSVMSPTETYNMPQSSEPTPGSNPQTPSVRSPSYGNPLEMSSGMGMDPSQSVFTAELPAEAKMLMGGMDMNDPFAQTLYGQDWMNSGQFYNPSEQPQATKLENIDPSFSSQLDFFDHDASTPVKWDPTLQPSNTTLDEQWDTFIDDTAWNNE